MKVVLQRVSEAKVTVAHEQIAQIASGALIYLAIERDDCFDDCVRIVDLVCKVQLFASNKQALAVSISAKDHAILVVPQFTLASKISKGGRHDFSNAEKPERANILFENFCLLLSEHHTVQKGRFGADMQVSSVNSGPVTLLI